MGNINIAAARLAAALLAIALSAAGGSLRGQDLAWRVPELGAVEYRRQLRATSAVATTHAAAKTAVPHEAVPDVYLPDLPPAPWLCQSELRADQKALDAPVRDLRDVVRCVGLDLAARGSGSWRFPRVLPFGDLAVTARLGAIGRDGAQELTATIDRRPPAVLPGEPRDQRDEVALLGRFDLDGTLVIRRQVDAAAGVVRAFTAELDVVVDEGKRSYRRIVVRDAWELVAVRNNQDADFRVRVAAAVRSGAAWIRKAIDGIDAAWLEDREDKRSYGSGRIALAAMTLLHADVPADDKVVQAAFAVLRRRRMIDTYSLATALMALAQLHAPPREAELIRSGQLQQRAVRTLDATEHKLAERWLGRLLENRDTRVDPARTLRFDYDGGARYDNSLSQYGLLGLDAAALCGLDIAASTWLAAGDHFLAVQCPHHGRSIDLELHTHRELALAAGGPLPRHAARPPTRGFAYQRAEDPAYGSLTAASIAGLVVARAGAARTGTASPAQLRALDDAIAQGFAWLAAEFDVRSNPGFVARADRHWYYWLYCLERACELAGIARIQGRDWYYEGALQLLSMQRGDGSFRGGGDAMVVEATCFAVLFLKKSTLPAITGG